MKIDFILLASGRSERFGDNKLLYRMNGYPMYMSTLSAINGLYQYPEYDMIGSVIVVTAYEELYRLREGYPVRTVWNEENHLGIARSVQLGVLEAGDQADAYMFFVCDQPYLTTETIRGMLRAYVQGSCSIGCVADGERTGNPCIFANRHRDELLSLSGDKGGKQIISKYEPYVTKYQVGYRYELIDIDKKTEAEHGSF